MQSDDDFEADKPKEADVLRDALSTEINIEEFPSVPSDDHDDFGKTRTGIFSSEIYTQINENNYSI